MTGRRSPVLNGTLALKLSREQLLSSVLMASSIVKLWEKWLAIAA